MVRVFRAMLVAGRWLADHRCSARAGIAAFA